MEDVRIELDEALKVVRAHWRCRTEECRSRLMDRLREDEDRTEATLRRVIADGKVDHRAWAMWAARDVLPRPRAAAVLRAAVERERRHDSVDLAIGELRKLDLELVRPLLPRLRRRLQGKDWHTMTFVLWLMADLRDGDALPAIERAIERARRDNYPYIARLGSIVAAVIRGEDSEILAAIGAHDHDRMQWLVEAARRMDTPEAHQTLEACALADFDVECRRECRAARIRGASDEIGYDDIRQQLRAEFGVEAVPDPPPARIYWHDPGGSLKTREVLSDDGTRTVVYRRPDGWLERLVQRLAGKRSDLI